MKVSDYKNRLSELFEKESRCATFTILTPTVHLDTIYQCHDAVKINFSSCEIQCTSAELSKRIHFGLGDFDSGLHAGVGLLGK